MCRETLLSELINDLSVLQWQLTAHRLDLTNEEQTFFVKRLEDAKNELTDLKKMHEMNNLKTQGV